MLDKKLTLTAGARQEDNQRVKKHNTYRATVGYYIPESGTRLHTSYGTGFYAPNLGQMYYPNNVGNEDLQPEKSRSFDIGVDQSVIKNKVDVGTTFFRTNVNDMIAYINDAKYITAGNTSGSHYVNLASVCSEGIENTVTLHPSHELTITGAHTYARARDNTTDGVIQRSPRNTGSVRVTYAPDEVEGLSVWGKARAASWSKTSNTAFVGGYTVVDFGSSYQVTDWAKVYGRVENLFDHHYYTASPGYATAGRGGYVGPTLTY